jgi:hypothetical protein
MKLRNMKLGSKLNSASILVSAIGAIVSGSGIVWHAVKFL